VRPWVKGAQKDTRPWAQGALGREQENGVFKVYLNSIKTTFKLC
jgi:hypothetical protein